LTRNRVRLARAEDRSVMEVSMQMDLMVTHSSEY